MSLSVVSLIAMVPDSECRMPTLIVSWAEAGVPGMRTVADKASAVAPASRLRVLSMGVPPEGSLLPGTLCNFRAKAWCRTFAQFQAVSARDFFTLCL